MNKEDFNQIKSGDLLLIRGRYLRTVQSGPGDQSPPGKFVAFSKLKRSWTNKPLTFYGYHDLTNMQVRRVGSNTHTLTTFEHERLVEQRFNPCKALYKELRSHRSADRRMEIGRASCRERVSSPV